MFSVFTKQKWRLDYKVWLSMLCILIACFILISFKLTALKSCYNFSIASVGLNNKKDSFWVDDFINFTASVHPEDAITWNFGDGSNEITGTYTMRHHYKKEGEYTITAKLNASCSQSIELRINSKANTDKPEISIIGDSFPEINKEVSYETNIDALHYEWSLISSGKKITTKKDSIAVFVFHSPGIYTLQLKLNNDTTQIGTQEIIVLSSEIDNDDKSDEDYVVLATSQKKKDTVENIQPSVNPSLSIQNQNQEKKETPPPNQPTSITTEKTKDVIRADNDYIQNLLQEYICGKLQLKDLDPYFCDDLKSTPLIATQTIKDINPFNSKTTIINTNIAAFCAKYSGKSFLITSVVCERKGDCVISVTLHFENSKKTKACPDN